MDYIPFPFLPTFDSEGNNSLYEQSKKRHTQVPTPDLSDHHVQAPNGDQPVGPEQTSDKQGSENGENPHFFENWLIQFHFCNFLHIVKTFQCVGFFFMLLFQSIKDYRSVIGKSQRSFGPVFALGYHKIERFIKIDLGS